MLIIWYSHNCIVIFQHLVDHQILLTYQTVYWTIKSGWIVLSWNKTQENQLYGICIWNQTYGICIWHQKIKHSYIANILYNVINSTPLSFSDHISSVCISCYLVLHKFASIRCYLLKSTATSFANALLSCMANPPLFLLVSLTLIFPGSNLFLS
jgi:hypothetical protein